MQSGCNLANVLKWLCSGKMVVFKKNGCNREKVVVIGISGSYREKVVVFGQE